MPSDLQDLRGEDRVQMKVLVRVDVIEPPPGAPKRLELRCDLRRNLAAHPGPKENIEGGLDHFDKKMTVGVDEVGEAFRLQDGAAIHQSEMQTHAQRGQARRTAHSVARRG